MAETRYLLCPRCKRVWQASFGGVQYKPGECCVECLVGEEAPGKTCVLEPVAVVPLAEWQALLALKARVDNAPLTLAESDKALEPIRGHVLMHLLAYRRTLRGDA